MDNNNTVITADKTCQCGEATGEPCTATGEIYVDYCPLAHAGTAAAAGSWTGLTVRLRVAAACDETLRTLWGDDGEATVYPDPYAYAAALAAARANG